MMLKISFILFLAYSVTISLAVNQTIPVASNKCNLDQLEYRLTRLEVQMSEKSNSLNSELREGNRRLNALELQSTEVQTGLESLKIELQRFVESQSLRMPSRYTVSNRHMSNIESRLDNLNKGVQLVVATLRGLHSDVTKVRKNITEIENNIKLVLANNEDLVTKSFLGHSLIDVKHHQIASHHHQSECKDRSNQQLLPRNCKEILDRGNNVSGIYRIQPMLASRAFMVLCDMETKDGGWTFIHNRYEGAQDFYLNWHSYKVGFGNLGGEFWLGLDHLHELTGSDINELLIELVDANLKKVEAYYSAFSVGNEIEGYALKVLGGYKGDAGDSLIYHAGSKFSTLDMDQDNWAEGSCAQSHHGAWWYRGCDTSNLNGQYLNGDVPEDYTYKGMYWGDFHGAQYSLMQARMMVRPRSEENLPPILPENFAH